ncbi:MAG: methyltransferase domain-containing protein [Alphaproteobacteria bacterium]|nr:methyltransferase domain-containing protein [Alphaproteobacteria bacterium]
MTNKDNAAIDYFNDKAEEVAAQYNALNRELVHADLLSLLPEDQTLQVLDIGAGSGADADMFAEKGHFVVAAEPAAALRELAMKTYDNMNIIWNADVLPEMAETCRAQMSFDVILASCVLQYLDEETRFKALEKIFSLTNVGGLIEVLAPVSPTREHQFPLSEGEVQKFIDDFNNSSEAGKQFEAVIEKTIPDFGGRKALDGSDAAFRLCIIRRLG